MKTDAQIAAEHDREIAECLVDIDVQDMTMAERQIAEMLVKRGHLALVGEVYRLVK